MVIIFSWNVHYCILHRKGYNYIHIKTSILMKNPQMVRFLIAGQDYCPSIVLEIPYGNSAQ